MREQKASTLLCALRSITGHPSLEHGYENPHISNESWGVALEDLTKLQAKSSRYWLTLHAILTQAIYPWRKKGHNYDLYAPVRREARELYRQFLRKPRSVASAVLFYEACRSPKNHRRIYKTFMEDWLKLFPEYQDFWNSTLTRRYSIMECAKELKVQRTTIVIPSEEEEALLSAAMVLPNWAPIDTYGSYGLDLLRLCRRDKPLLAEAVAYTARYLAYVEKRDKGMHSPASYENHWANLLRCEIIENWPVYSEAVIESFSSSLNHFESPFALVHSREAGSKEQLLKLLMCVGHLLTAEEIEKVLASLYHDEYPRVLPHFKAFLVQYPEKLKEERIPEILAYAALSAVPLIGPRPHDRKPLYDRDQLHRVSANWKRYTEEQREAAFNLLVSDVGRNLDDHEDERLLRIHKEHGFYQLMYVSEYESCSNKLIEAGMVGDWWVLRERQWPSRSVFQSWLNNLQLPYARIRNAEEIADRIVEGSYKSGKALREDNLAKALLEKGYYSGEVDEALVFGALASSHPELAIVVWHSPWTELLSRARLGLLSARHIRGFLLCEEISDEEIRQYFTRTLPLRDALLSCAVDTSQKICTNDKLELRARGLLETYPELWDGVKYTLTEERISRLINRWLFGAVRLIPPHQLAELLLGKRTKGLELFDPDIVSPSFLKVEVKERVRGKLLKNEEPVYDTAVPTKLNWVKWVLAYGFQKEPAFASRLQKLRREDVQVARLIPVT